MTDEERLQKWEDHLLNEYLDEDEEEENEEYDYYGEKADRDYDDYIFDRMEREYGS